MVIPLSNTVVNTFQGLRLFIYSNLSLAQHLLSSTNPMLRTAKIRQKSRSTRSTIYLGMKIDAGCWLLLRSLTSAAGSLPALIPSIHVEISSCGAGTSGLGTSSAFQVKYHSFGLIMMFKINHIKKRLPYLWRERDPSTWPSVSRLNPQVCSPSRWRVKW